MRRSPCEWLTAATRLKLIGFTAEDFFKLESEEEGFRNWLNQASSPAELMDAFQPALRNRPVAEPAEREVMRQLVSSSSIVEASQLRNLPDDGAIGFGILSLIEASRSQLVQWLIKIVCTNSARRSTPSYSG